jgi:hypothetical protein
MASNRSPVRARLAPLRDSSKVERLSHTQVVMGSNPIPAIAPAWRNWQTRTIQNREGIAHWEFDSPRRNLRV